MGRGGRVSRFKREITEWTIEIPEHSCGRHRVPAQSRTEFREQRVDALREAVIGAHIDADVPPWRPFLRQTARLASMSSSVRVVET